MKTIRIRKPKRIGEKVVFRVDNKPVIIIRELSCYKINVNGREFYLHKNASTDEIAKEIFKKLN